MIHLSPQRRNKLILLALALTLSAFFLLYSQFFRIQILQYTYWNSRAERQHYFLVKQPFKRGTFYSNTSIQKGGYRPVPFAIDVPLYHLYADPSVLPKNLHKELQESMLRMLSPTLKESIKLSSELARKTRSRRLISWISEQQKNKFSSWWKKFAKEKTLPGNGLFFIRDFKRFHPMGKTLGQVLHTIQERRNEKTGNAIPTGGLELSLNKFLQGSMGIRRLMRSPHNNLTTGEILKEPIHGSDIELTINHCLQAIAEEELEKGVKFHQAKSGIAIIVHPYNGHILALAQYPFFFPDQYTKYFNDPARTIDTNIHAITHAREPGSPTKAFTLALALHANRILKQRGAPPLFHPFEKIQTDKGVFPGRSKPLKDVRLHHYLNMYMAIQKSSNVYMAILADRIIETMGPQWYYETLQTMFGIGKKTGVELGGESPGFLPKPYSLTSSGKLAWSQATPYSLAIGYNFQTTALQMTRAFCAIATKGILPTLTLVRRIIQKTKNTQNILVDNTKKERIEQFPRVLHPDDCQEIIYALKFATKPGGGGYKANIFGYTQAGKTGTSMKLINGQYSHRHHYSRFIGFAPASSPSFVLFVGLDEPKPGFIPGIGLNHRGGQCAAPIFREIATRTLAFLSVPMDDPLGFSRDDPRGAPENADWYQEVEALNKLYKKWNS